MSLTETMFLPSSAISICVEEEPPHAPSQPEAMNEQVIRGPLDYLLLMPGKDMRKKLTMAFNEWLGVPEEKISIISDIVNLLHTASLLIDDIQDSSKLRRGSPVAHSIFGTAQTINSANYAYFLAQERLSLLNNPKASQVFVEELLSLHKGQGMDLYWRDTLTCPSEEDYIEMVSNKTGGLFRLAVKLMQLESDKDCDCIPLTNKLGIIFQIRDDVLNLQAKLYAQNKGFCEDITEGKFSFPIIHSIRSDPNNGQLMNILRQKTEDVNLKAYAVDYIKSTNSFTHSNQTVERYLSEARDLVECLNQENGVSRGILHFLEMLKPEDSPAPETPTGYIKIN